jgi:hypothetical protein
MIKAGGPPIGSDVSFANLRSSISAVTSFSPFWTTLIVLVEFGPEHLRRTGISAKDWPTEFQAPGFTACEVDEMTGHVRPLRPVAELASVHPLNLLLRQPPTALPELQFE